MSQAEQQPDRVEAFLLNRRAKRLAKQAISHVNAGDSGFFVNENSLIGIRPNTYSEETYAAVAEKLSPHNIAIEVRRARIEPSPLSLLPTEHDRIIISTSQPPEFSDPAYPFTKVIWPPSEQHLNSF